jgi:hypothetical protein
MKTLLLLIVLALAALSFTAMTAEHTNVTIDGYNWATKFCSSAHGACKYPHEIGYAALGFGVFWLLVLIMT